MKSFVHYENIFYEKRKFNSNQDENYFLQFMKILLVFLVLFLIWNGYSHYKQINLMNNGTAVSAEVLTYSNGEYFSFVAEDGSTYGNNISGIFLPEHDDTILVYYLDNPADAMPLTSPHFFYTMYAISIAGISLVFWKMKRMKDSINKNKTLAKEEY